MVLKTIEYIVVVVLGLLPIANPFSTAPIFIGLSSRLDEGERRKLAGQACLYMAGILLTFLLAGTLVLSFFGITVNGLRTAGGLIIAFIGFRMLFPAEHDDVNEYRQASQNAKNVAFTPLAMPMLSGPGSIAVIIGMAAEVSTREVGEGLVIGYILVALGILTTSFICWLVLRASTRVVRILGDSGIDALTRIMGFFLICIGVEFVFAGVRGLISNAEIVARQV